MEITNNFMIQGIAVIITTAVTFLYLYKAFTSSASKEKKEPSSLEVKEAKKQNDYIDRSGKAIHPEEWRLFSLAEKEELSHDSRRFRFRFQNEADILGLPIGQHISLKFDDQNGKTVIRSYTPVSSDDDVGYVDFVIKIYFPNVHPKFPDGGKMSQYINNLKIGDKLAMKGPKGHLEYKGRGDLIISRKQTLHNYHASQLGMIAGGTGITPMLQIIRAALKDPEDNTEIYLIYANQTEEDILLRSELETLMSTYPKRFHLHYTVDRPTDSWTYSVGFVDKTMCENHLPKLSKETMVLMCGPPPMIKFACEPALKELGFAEDQLFAF